MLSTNLAPSLSKKSYSNFTLMHKSFYFGQRQQGAHQHKGFTPYCKFKQVYQFFLLEEIFEFNFDILQKCLVGFPIVGLSLVFQFFLNYDFSDVKKINCENLLSQFKNKIPCTHYTFFKARNFICSMFHDKLKLLIVKKIFIIFFYSFHGVKFINVSFQIFMVTFFVIMVFMVHFFKVTCDTSSTTIFFAYKSIFTIVNAIFCGDMLPQKFEIHKSKEGIILM